MVSRPAESRFLSNPTSPFELSVFSTNDLAAYIARLGLDQGIISEPPSLELLSTLLTTHQLKVPYDSSSLHVRPSDWEGPSKPIQFGNGNGMQLGEQNFLRITQGGQGGEFGQLGYETGAGRPPPLRSRHRRLTVLGPNRRLLLRSPDLLRLTPAQLWVQRQRHWSPGVPAPRPGPKRSRLPLVRHHPPCPPRRLGRQQRALLGRRRLRRRRLSVPVSFCVLLKLMSQTDYGRTMC